MSEKEQRTLLIVDDHPIMRYGLVQLIAAEDDLSVCGEAGTAREAMEAAQALDPDLILVDMTLPDKSGLELIKDIRAQGLRARLLVVSMHDETLYAERALRAGARGYIMKEVAAEHLIHAIRKVLDGGLYVSEAMAERLLEVISGRPGDAAAGSLSRLTDREIEVFELIGNGKGTRDIAEQLHVSVRTIDAHRAHIKDKLQFRDGNELVRHAVRWVETGEIE